jgi:LmbE family N-acetylglucosaminyl deacetylase
MNRSFPVTKEIVVLAPHPDDEALGCSGSIIIMNKKGISSTIVFLSDGESLNGEPSADVAEQRRADGRRAAELMGCEKVIFLGFPDGEIDKYQDEICEKLIALIAEKESCTLLAPSPVDYHKDHRAAANIAICLQQQFNGISLAFYEVYSTVRFTHLVDISDVLEDKKKVILNYHTSLYGKPEVYVHAMLGLNAQRAIFTQKKSYYEAFFVIEKQLTHSEIINWIIFSS